MAKRGRPPKIRPQEEKPQEEAKESHKPIKTWKDGRGNTIISTHSVGLEGCKRGDTSNMITTRDVLDRQAEAKEKEQA